MYLCTNIPHCVTHNSYIAIDLKSFYASVECVERGLDPLTTNLVVADESRTDKTICLAVSPSMKAAFGLGGRPRLFEVRQRVPRGTDYIVAPPRMALYKEVSRNIHNIYLQYIAPEDIHIYSIDEVFIDASPYLKSYRLTPRQLAMKMIREVLRQTGITATAGIGTNLYLCKVAMDILAKKMPADKNGVRIAELDEMSYRRQLWDHKPLTDFWRIGPGTMSRLERLGIDTMGKIARLSVDNDEALYTLFGINAELLIDHAWGWEPVMMKHIKAYRPQTRSLSNGQVLPTPYTKQKARTVIREMADSMALQLVASRLVADRITITVGYDKTNLDDPERMKNYTGSFSADHYGRKVPRHAHGTKALGSHTSSSSIIMDAVTQLFARLADDSLLIRHLNLTANNVEQEGSVAPRPLQLDIFTTYEAIEQKRKQEVKQREREQRLQEARLKINQRYGKNAILKGLNFDDGATGIERNLQIGGHKA